MAKKRSRKKDFLAGHGMSPAQQHAAVMRAAAVPVSDFEGEYQGPGSYTSEGAQFIQRKIWGISHASRNER